MKQWYRLMILYLIKQSHTTELTITLTLFIIRDRDIVFSNNFSLSRHTISTHFRHPSSPNQISGKDGDL